MNELQVIVQQEPGRVHWNFEDLKTALQEEMQLYEGAIYDASSIKAAKSDVAMLRKLKKAVEDKRKEIKNKCLKPYEAIEEQAKELNALIDRPIEMISAQVSDYEAKQREAKKAEIMQYMGKAFDGMPDQMKATAKDMVYDSRWENATAKKSEWKAAIDNMAKKVADDTGVLSRTETNPDYLNIALNIYQRALNLGDALDKLNELHTQEQIMIERRRKAEEAAEAKKVEEKQAAEPVVESHASITQNSELPWPEPSPEPEPVRTAPGTADKGYRFKAIFTVYAQNEKEIDDVYNYLKFMGIYSEVVRG